MTERLEKQNSHANPQQVCEECGHHKFVSPKESVLFRYYSFITPQNLTMCTRCGAKFIFCLNCGLILNQVHLSLEKYLIKYVCTHCKSVDDEVKIWLQNQS